MADINVVPKRRTSAWVWIAVAIVVALIVWAVMAGSGPGTQPVSRADAPVPAFASVASDGGADLAVA